MSKKVGPITFREFLKIRECFANAFVTDLGTGTVRKLSGYRLAPLDRGTELVFILKGGQGNWGGLGFPNRERIDFFLLPDGSLLVDQTYLLEVKRGKHHSRRYAHSEEEE